MSGESDPATTGIEDTLSLGPRANSDAVLESEAIKQIGLYRLLQRIGEGGMGEVWLAEQVEPVRRKVAIKVIKAGMDTKQVVARFESERQALALMDHPAIAKVLDAGATLTGRPYFVMEYVPGVSITEHCDCHRLSTEERLKIFMQICVGVQHAHQKAIIHRDLKPSNILVSLIDGKPQPKIIDFGIAKAIGQRLTERTLVTEIGAVIGTPEYMSPEQADLSDQDVDTRTDIYSLGVILYELLTGRRPFESEELRSLGYAELWHKLRKVDPPSPSTKLASPGSGAAEAARRRATDAASLRRSLEGDLDAITMKALEKDRAHRYGTATELASDVGRFLSDEPVLARAQSRSYRIWKYVRRHRLGVSIAAALFALLAGFAASMTLQARRIGEERDRANAERDRANAERDSARAWVLHAGDLAGSQRVVRTDWAPTLNPAYVATLDKLLFKTEELLRGSHFFEAEKLSRDTLSLGLRESTSENLYTIWARSLLGEALLGLLHHDEAERVLRDAYPAGRRILLDALLGGSAESREWPGGLRNPATGEVLNAPLTWDGARVQAYTGAAKRACLDLARALVRQGKREEAMDVLVDALDNGLTLGSAASLSEEDDFRSLRDSPRFQLILRRAKGPRPEKQGG